MSANPMDLGNSWVMVTGASSGIGRETAILLSELNARVILVARNTERLEATRQRLSGDGHRVESFDLSAVDEIPAWLKGVATSTGPLRGLVHCAGIQHTLPLRSVSAAKIEELLRINLTSTILLAKAFRQRGCSIPGGSLVLLSSAAGIVSQPAIAAYSASKAGLIGLARSLALELAPEKLRVNCVAPGWVESEMLAQFRNSVTPERYETLQKSYPLGLGTPRDVAYAVAFLLADTARWITGATLVVDGGFSVQ